MSRANDLESSRKARWGEAGTDCGCRMAGEVKGISEGHGMEERDLLSFNLPGRGSFRGKSLGGESGGQQEVIGLKEFPEGMV